MRWLVSLSKRPIFILANGNLYGDTDLWPAVIPHSCDEEGMKTVLGFTNNNFQLAHGGQVQDFNNSRERADKEWVPSGVKMWRLTGTVLDW